MSENINLNIIPIPHTGDSIIHQSNYSARSSDNTIEVYFQNIEQVIINKIKRYHQVLGCSAWFTNKNILKELAHKETCLFVISNDNINTQVLNLYNSLKHPIKPLNEYGIYGVNIASNNGLNHAVRKCGNLLSSTKYNGIFPRMHNKFMILMNKTGINLVCEKLLLKTSDRLYWHKIVSKLAENTLLLSKSDLKILFSHLSTYERQPTTIDRRVIQVAQTNNRMLLLNDRHITSHGNILINDVGEVIIQYQQSIYDMEIITGSYNYTENSNNNHENIVCFKDKKIADAYLKQFTQIASLSHSIKNTVPNDIIYGLPKHFSYKQLRDTALVEKVPHKHIHLTAPSTISQDLTELNISYTIKDYMQLAYNSVLSILISCF